MRKTVRKFQQRSFCQKGRSNLNDVLDELDELSSFRKERLSRRRPS